MLPASKNMGGKAPKSQQIIRGSQLSTLVTADGASRHGSVPIPLAPRGVFEFGRGACMRWTSSVAVSARDAPGTWGVVNDQ